MLDELDDEPEYVADEPDEYVADEPVAYESVFKSFLVFDCCFCGLFGLNDC